MAKGMKSLAKDTAIYGVSSIVGKFIGWLLVSLYTYNLAETGDYGIVTNLYAWTALLLVILTYGMETGFFRFVNKDLENAPKVYGNTLIPVGFTSLLFALLIVLFSKPIAGFLGYSAHPEFIWMLGLSVAMDAFASIPFANLRFLNKPYLFAGLKMLYIAIYVVLNLFFLLLCPWLMKVAPGSVSWFFNPDYGVGYIFVSNVMATAIQTLVLSKFLFLTKFKFDGALLKQILKYSYPLLLLGIAGVANQNLDKILFPFLNLSDEGLSDLGIYGAVGKISVVIMMFTQAFRYAYEPFVFAKNRDQDNTSAYSTAMTYFVIFSLLIFLAVTMYMDLIKYMVSPMYWTGLPVVPIIMLSFIFQGVYFNLSIWYKLKDKNYYGAWFSAAGTLIIIVGNIIFVPQFSYWGSVWSLLAGFFAVMLLSYFFGQKHMPIRYDLKKIGLYTLLALVLFVVSLFINTPCLICNLALKTVLLAAFIVYAVKNDFPLEQIPFINKLTKRS